MSDARGMRAWFPILLAGFLLTAPAAAFDLSRAERSTLDNGLTVLVLEAPALPVVSVQMLYNVGARDEPAGRTGIAHFLEHMAFRATENFPDTGVVSSIYAVGGEWHGYTWIDQTTYYETLPAENLDVALAIEADRMARLVIPAHEVDAERGAVLAEMHGYDNNPASVLKDAVLAVSFLQHPYRNNTIGWESDVRAIGRDDLVDFYRRHYRPANAVLAVVGRVSPGDVFARVAELFGGFPGGPQTALPATVEPPQTGLRRVELAGAGERNRFEVVYRAPAVTDPDYPGFLLLQQILAGGLGVNFAQNQFGDPVRPGTRLEGITDDLVTWFPPQAMPYVFSIAGSTDPEEPTAAVEARLEEAVARLREELPSSRELAAARRALLDELVFDLETTEDAAHQLAYFEGLGGLDVLLGLPARLAEVGPDDIRRVAAEALAPERRTIGWILARRAPAESSGRAVSEAPATGAMDEARAEPAAAAAAAKSTETVAEPTIRRLAGGLTVLFQRMSLSSSAHLRLVFTGTELELPELDLPFAAAPGLPLWRHSSVGLRFRPRDLEAALRGARRIVDEAVLGEPVAAASLDDPAARLSATLDEALGMPPRVAPRPIALVLAGDLEEAALWPLLETILGDIAPGPSKGTGASSARASEAQPAAGAEAASRPREIRVAIDAKKAQAQLGYVVAAPAAGAADSLAWRLLLYVLSHGYEGRLGKEAISRRGLVYWIGASYAADRTAGRVALEIGVDPPNLEPMRRLMLESLEGLSLSPPTEAEIAEAKAHLAGRRGSANQSNAEVTAALAQEWGGLGRLLSDEEFAVALGAVSREDVLRVIPNFRDGVLVTVEVGR